jgi:hypothetical protein
MRIHDGNHPGPTIARRDQGRLQGLRRTPRDGCRAPHDEQRCHRTGPRRLCRRDLVGTGRQRPGTPVLRPRRLDGRRRVTQSHMPDYTHPSNIESRLSSPMKATGLDQFKIGLDHGGPGISTNSARGPETTGNNRDDSDKNRMRGSRPTPPRDGPPSGSTIGIFAGHG